MRRFIFSGVDSLSDAGGWDVVVIAHDLEEARKHLILHLAELNQTDKKHDCSVDEDQQITGVVYSNVELWR